MNQPSLIAIAQQMIAHVTNDGRTPVMFLMNQGTMNEVAQSVAFEHKCKLSVFGRAWLWIRTRNTTPKLESLCGLPVSLAPFLPPGQMFLQCAAPPPAGLPSVQVKPTRDYPTPAPSGVMEEFVEQENRPAQVAPQPEKESGPTLKDLSTSKGESPSVTDVLIKALEGADDLKQVIVIRVHHNNNVDMALNCNQFEAPGILQKAQYYLAMRGD